MADVHKDFHGALSLGLQFVEDRHGREGVREFLEGLADSVYAPLVEDLRARGLPALRDHWRTVFDLEDGDVDIDMDNDTLVVDVHCCPALAHIKARGYAVAEHFCEHTRILNDAICRAAGYSSSVDYDQAAERCVQKFWRAAP